VEKVLAVRREGNPEDDKPTLGNHGSVLIRIFEEFIGKIYCFHLSSLKDGRQN
jgi:hypothetical protein